MKVRTVAKEPLAAGAGLGAVGGGAGLSAHQASTEPMRLAGQRRPEGADCPVASPALTERARGACRPRREAHK